MKILIVSAGRSGSSNLFKGIYKSLNNSKGYYEPSNLDCSTWYDNVEGKIDYNYPKLVVKTLSHQWLPINEEFQHSKIYNEFYGYSFFNYSTSYLTQKFNKYYSLFFPNFDSIILLTRKNEIEAAKSWSYIYEKEVVKEEAHKPYILPPSVNYLKYLPLVRNYNDLVYNISKNYDLPLTYYEDIFTENQDIINSFLKLHNIKLDNPEFLYESLHPKNKYRQN